MNKTLVSGVIIGIVLLFVVRFPSDSVTLLENIGSILGDVWDAIRDVIREFI